MGINKYKKTLLIVDDEPSILESLKDVFSLYYNVVCAKDGLELVEKMKTNHEIDAVISDIKMPNMTGIEAIKKLKEEGIYVPFIFLTGYGDDSIMNESFSLGAIDFLDKPFDFGQLVEIVNNLINIGSELKEMNKSIESGLNKSELFNKKINNKNLLVKKTSKAA